MIMCFGCLAEVTSNDKDLKYVVGAVIVPPALFDIPSTPTCSRRWYLYADMHFSA
jgi:hypothetical protein